jgi:hypothetical protein
MFNIDDSAVDYLEEYVDDQAVAKKADKEENPVGQASNMTNHRMLRNTEQCIS